MSLSQLTPWRKGAERTRESADDGLLPLRQRMSHVFDDFLGTVGSRQPIARRLPPEEVRERLGVRAAAGVPTPAAVRRPPSSRLAETAAPLGRPVVASKAAQDTDMRVEYSAMLQVTLYEDGGHAHGRRVIAVAPSPEWPVALDRLCATARTIIARRSAAEDSATLVCYWAKATVTVVSDAGHIAHRDIGPVSAREPRLMLRSLERDARQRLLELEAAADGWSSE